MTAKLDALPDLETVVPEYRENEKTRQFVRHNLTIWRDINGAADVARAHRIEFDPRHDYWYQSERRFLIAYFGNRLSRSYAPAEALRSLAAKTFLHFDRARQDGRLGEPVLASRYKGGWPALAEKLREIGAELPQLSEYDELKPTWRRLKYQSIREDLLTYLDEVAEKDDLGDFEPAFFKRLRWFPYIGLSDLSELEARQLFFGSFYLLFTSTNSYKVGGGMSFAPVLQNNPTGVLLDHVDNWANGESPEDTGFVVCGKDDEKDKSHYTPVVELFGFLNLHRQPFYNSVAAAYDSFAKPEDRSVFPRVRRIGEKTREFLAANPTLAEELSREFRTLVRGLDPPDEIPMEGVYGTRAVQQHPGERDKQVDRKLNKLVCERAVAKADSLADPDAAVTLFHIMLDAVTYQSHLATKVSAVVETPPTYEARRHESSSQQSAQADQPPQLADIELPISLTGIANDALAYLRGGFHVLLAGAPGTGKTTVAQLVGNAWNQQLDQVRTKISVSEAPMTTVANSAWAPFHTIGGILPDDSGKFRAQKGIFIDPQFEQDGAWRLRGECVVLDEMNRADLDRCIGELYPLLTNNVASVAPAGIPGVRRVLATASFRIVATVNDSTID